MKQYKISIGVGILVVIVILLVIGTRQTNAPVISETGTEIPCLPNGHQQVAVHIHPILTIISDGQAEAIPANIGIEGACMREVHTHDTNGKIHIETAEFGVTYTLADFFAVWGQSVEREGYSVEILQDGEIQESTESVILADHSEIVIRYSKENIDESIVVSAVYPPTFTWSFQESDTLSLDGLPETQVMLAITDTHGTTQTKIIDTIPGGCNEIDASEEDTDIVQGTEKIQCYYAGLGHWYKIVQGEDSYAVERKTFEEASPAYDPPTYEYETILEMPIR